MNEIEVLPKNAEWYGQLVDECKTIVVERRFRAEMESIECWHEVGKRISCDENYQKFSKGNTKAKRQLASDIGVSVATIYQATQFYDQYPVLSSALERFGKNVSWYKITTGLLSNNSKQDKEVVPLPKGKYNVIYADPPWDVKAGPGWNSSGESRDLLYPTMSLEQIKNLPVRSLSGDDAHLYLWTINKYIPETYEIAKEWGFEPSCLLTWVKPPHGIGLGGTFIQTTEHLLFCRRGTLEAIKRIDSTWFEFPRGKHSEKPKEIRKMIEEVSPGNKVELFARGKPEIGWTFWGNEIEV